MSYVARSSMRLARPMRQRVTRANIHEKRAHWNGAGKNMPSFAKTGCGQYSFIIGATFGVVSIGLGFRNGVYQILGKSLKE